jgi:hypothetical protein
VLQIALCESDLAKADNGQTKSKWLSVNVFIIVAITLPDFSHRATNNRNFGSAA